MNKIKAVALFAVAALLSGCATKYTNTSYLNGVRIETYVDSWPHRCQIRQATAFNTTGEDIGGVDSYLTAVTKDTRQTVGEVRVSFPPIVAGGQAHPHYANGYVFRGYPCDALTFHTKGFTTQ